MQLSKNLTLEEACVTGTGLINTPGEAEIDNLQAVALNVFQACRDHFGKPLKVNSGYRCKAVNRAVGGASNSQHTTGQALDLDYGNAEDNKKLFDYIRKNLIFDQVINENGYAWIHVSYNSAFNRRQVLEMVKVNGQPTYRKL